MPTRYVHTNLIAKDWKRLKEFYQEVFDCVPVPPERDLSGKWLDRATGIVGAHIRGMHLRLPGYGDDGPTLELFQYDCMPEHPAVGPSTPGFAHLAFRVDDVRQTACKVLAHGGTAVGELTVREIPGMGMLTFQYLADPEGNIIEVQNLTGENQPPIPRGRGRPAAGKSHRAGESGRQAGKDTKE